MALHKGVNRAQTTSGILPIASHKPNSCPNQDQSSNISSINDANNNNVDNNNNINNNIDNSNNNINNNEINNGTLTTKLTKIT